MPKRIHGTETVRYAPAAPGDMSVSATHVAGYHMDVEPGRGHFEKFEYLHDPKNHALATIFDSQTPELDAIWVDIAVRTPGGEAVEISLPGEFVTKIGHVIKVRQSRRARAHLRHLQE